MKAKGWGFVAAAAWVAGCGASDSARERTGSASSEIQAGATDSTHTFAVGVVQVNASTIEFCSGVLLAPNLVATARHCVAQISSPQIDCSKSTFGALVSTSTLYVTTDTVIAQHSNFIPVAANGIKVPAASSVCGNDIALLILSQSISLPGGYPAGYVVPAVTPPLTDPTRSTTITAIGYGIDTPTDDAGTTAGTRRIKENVALSCIPNDPNFVDCFSDPSASQYMTVGEFISGDQTTCEGDSGSSVFDQAQFNAGKWVSYGVLSRGSVSSDGLNCVQPIYTRFDMWSSLVVDAARTAAAAGRYALPSWASATTTTDAGSSSDSAMTTVPEAATASSSGGSEGGASGGTATGSSTGTTPTLGADGTVCSLDSNCLSGNCVAFDGMHYFCGSACGSGQTCADKFVCKGPAGNDFCFPASSVGSAGSGSSGGCSIAVAGVGSASRDRTPSSFLAGLLGALGAILTARTGRRPGTRPARPP
jgi:hypothetical protein